MHPVLDQRSVQIFLDAFVQVRIDGPGIAFGASGEHYVRFAFTLDRQILQESVAVMQELFK